MILHRLASDRLPDVRTRVARLGPGPRALLLGTTGILTSAVFVWPVVDPDYWMHVRVGRWIVDHRRLPAHDLFTYTVPGHPWVDHEYLSQVLMWLIHSHLGVTGASAVFGALTWLGMLLVIAAARPLTQPPVIVAVGWLLGALAGAPVWGPRPQMLTFVFVGLELLWLRRSIDGRSRAILWLPLVMLLWSNLHGSWPVGFLFLVIALLHEALAWFADRSQPGHLAQVRRLVLVGVASAAAVLVNPNGPAIVAYPWWTITSGAQQNLIVEWLSPDFHTAAVRPFEVMLLLLLAGLAFGRPRLFDVLLVAAGTALALESVRNITIFVAATTPVLIACWSDCWRRVGERWTGRPRGATRPWQQAVNAALLALVAVATVARTAETLAQQPTQLRAAAPVGAADWLAAHPHVGTHMFNRYSWGSYLAYRFYPEPNRRVFVFGEGVLMGDDQILRYERVASIGPGWKRELARTGVDYVVIDRGSALDDALATQPDWRQVYRDATAAIYVRVAGSG